jgi:hypothetical protein
MNEDAGKLGASAVESDTALAKERAGVYIAATIAEPGRGVDADGRTAKRGESAEDGAESMGLGGEELVSH